MVNLLRWVGGLGCLCLGLALLTADAQQVLPPVGPPTAIACAYNTSPPTVASGNAIWVQCDTNGKLITSGSTTLSGTTSNAASAVATSATNIPTVSYNYVFNGTTWDQVSSLSVGSKHAPTVAIVDGSGNQITSFGGGSASNASSGVATSSTNSQSVSWLYGFNGATWDQLQVDGSKSLKVVASSPITNPTSTLTSGTGTAMTSANNFITNSTKAAPSYNCTATTGSPCIMRRWRLSTNATTGWGSTLNINFWSAAPTYTNGDGAVYAVATGGANFLGSCAVQLTQYADAASGVCAPDVGNEINFVPSGQSVFWDLRVTATLTKTSGQTFTLTAEDLNP